MIQILSFLHDKLLLFILHYFHLFQILQLSKSKVFPFLVIAKRPMPSKHCRIGRGLASHRSHKTCLLLRRIIHMYVLYYFLPSVSSPNSCKTYFAYLMSCMMLPSCILSQIHVPLIFRVVYSLYIVQPKCNHFLLLSTSLKSRKFDSILFICLNWQIKIQQVLSLHSRL